MLYIKMNESIYKNESLTRLCRSV